MSSVANKRLHSIVSQLTAPAKEESTHAVSVAVKPVAGSGGGGGSGQLADHVSIITGSGQGIGAAAALLFAAEGSKVVVTDIDAKKSDAIANEINAKYGAGTALSVPGDVTAKDFPDRIIKATIDTYGKLNILVNNAGYTWDAMAHKMTDEQFDAMIKVHNTAPFRLIRAAAPYMRDVAKAEIDAGGVVQNRCVLNVSSTSGLHGNIGQISYACAKAGINGLTKTLAKEWGPFRVRCNSIAFGLIETRLTQDKSKGAFMQVGDKKVSLGIPVGGGGQLTKYDMIPLRRPGTPAEAAGGLLLLASPHAAYITGHTLEVTGGAGI